MGEYLIETQELLEDLKEKWKHGYHVDYSPNLDNLIYITQRAQERVYRLSGGQHPRFNLPTNGNLHKYNSVKYVVQQNTNVGSNQPLPSYQCLLQDIWLSRLLYRIKKETVGIRENYLDRISYNLGNGTILKWSQGV